MSTYHLADESAEAEFSHSESQKESFELLFQSPNNNIGANFTISDSSPSEPLQNSDNIGGYMMNLNDEMSNNQIGFYQQKPSPPINLFSLQWQTSLQMKQLNQYPSEREEESLSQFLQSSLSQEAPDRTVKGNQLQQTPQNVNKVQKQRQKRAKKDDDDYSPEKKSKNPRNSKNISHWASIILTQSLKFKSIRQSGKNWKEKYPHQPKRRNKKNLQEFMDEIYGYSSHIFYELIEYLLKTFQNSKKYLKKDRQKFQEEIKKFASKYPSSPTNLRGQNRTISAVYVNDQ